MLPCLCYHESPAYAADNIIVGTVKSKEKPRLPQTGGEGKAEMEQGVNKPGNHDNFLPAQAVREHAGGY